MRKQNPGNLAVLAIISGLIAFGILSTRAEVEPGDNTTAGATDVTATLLQLGQDEFGTLIDGDKDYYKITNTTAPTKPYTVEISLLSVVGADQASLKVFEADGVTQIGATVTTVLAGGMDEGQASIDVPTADFPVGATIIVCIEPVSLPTSRPYTLSGKFITLETESNDLTGTADDLPIYPENNPPCFGRGKIDNGEMPDYWKITNSAGFDRKLDVYFVHFSGMEKIRLRILKANGTTEIFNAVSDITKKNIIEFEIPSPAPGEVFFLCIEDDTLTMEVPYQIDVQGFNNSPAAAGPNNAAAIAAQERNCKKLRKKIKKAKSRSKIRRLKKKLKKCKKKLRALKG